MILIHVSDEKNDVSCSRDRLLQLSTFQFVKFLFFIQQHPIDRVEAKKLAYVDLFRTCYVAERINGLSCVRASDRLGTITRNQDGKTGTIQSCLKSLPNDVLPPHAYNTLTSWHAGMSCQNFLRPQQAILFDCVGLEVAEEFDRSWDKDIDEYEDRDGATYRRFRVFMLPKGTVIPDNIGIEQDGLNHITIYPKNQPFHVTKVTDWSSFHVDDFLPLVSKWKKFAVLEMKCNGLFLPLYFPPDQDTFPVRHFLEEILLNGSPENALQTYEAVSLLESGRMSLLQFLKLMNSVGTSHLLLCDGNNFIFVVQPCIKALRYWLTLLEISTNAKDETFSMWIKSTTLSDRMQEKALAEDKDHMYAFSRNECHLEGGQSVPVVEVIGSIDILFLNVKVSSSSAPVYLPFWYENKSLNMKVLFDEIDVLPFVEEDSDAKCASVTPAQEPSSEYPEKVIIEFNSKVAVSVPVSITEKQVLLQSTICCSGYTIHGRRCKNKRKGIESQNVWCHHHVQQKVELENFQKFGEFRPEAECALNWWKPDEIER
jgi:hypothetical protein